MTRLRVLYLVPPSAHFAGIERVVHEVATGLAAEYPDEFDVHVAFCTAYDEEVLKDTAYTLHVLGVDRLLAIPRPLRRLVKTLRPDVVICPQVEASVVGWIATRGLKIRDFYAHLHGNPALEEAEGTRRTRAAFAFFRRAMARRITGVLAVSPSLAAYTAASFVPETPVRFVKNPVRRLAAASADRPASDGAFRFVSVGRLSRQKGQDVVLRALALAREDLPPVELVLVGNGPAEAELRALTAELGVGDLVRFAGYASDPVPYLAAADCFVLASRWEGFGVALAEALQFGLPLLTTDCRFGPSDLVVDDEIGTIVPLDDPAALAAGLVREASRPPSAAAADRRRGIAAEYLPGPAVASHRDVLLSGL